MASARVARLPAGAAACSDAGAGAFTGLGPPAARFTPLVGASSIGVSCVDEPAASAAGSAGAPRPYQLHHGPEPRLQTKPAAVCGPPETALHLQCRILSGARCKSTAIPSNSTIRLP